MNKETLRKLQEVREYPALTILLPTYHKSPDDLQQNPVRLKKLIRQGIDKLLSEFSRSEIGDLLANLDAATDAIDFHHPSNGLAIFASASIGESFPLSFVVKEQVIIDGTFATRYVVHAENRSKRYLFLLLSREICRLYDCQRDSLTEVHDYGFPYTANNDGVATEWTGDFGVDSGRYDMRRAREFIRGVDDALTTAINNNDLPLVVGGVERNLAFFNNVSQHSGRVLSTITGNYEKTPVPELAKIAWGAARQGFDRKRREVLDRLDNAVGAKQFASGIDGVWRMAHEGRVATLLVEEEFHYPAAVSEDGLSLKSIGSNHNSIAISDAVDEIIETVMRSKGQVVFQEKGALKGHQQIAAITRF